MKLLISAAEISSDIQAEACLKAFIKKCNESGETVQIAGIGGPKIRALPNFFCVEEAENLRAMGFAEVIGKIPFIKKTQKRLVNFAAEFKPDVIITFDYPDFHLGLMKRLNQKKYYNN